MLKNFFPSVTISSDFFRLSGQAAMSVGVTVNARHY
jgi:hypothetical protein